MKAIASWIFCLFFYITEGCLNVQLAINRTKDHVSYGVPIKIDNLDYALMISLKDTDEYLKSTA